MMLRPALAIALLLIFQKAGGPMPLPVVPGAFGFGMDTRAAYGAGANPTVYRVQNLLDSGSHSLREALEASGPRVVIFEISGSIVLQADIHITNPYLTVAGQTAPSPGITIRGVSDMSTVSAGGISIETHDVLFQHVRIRIGDGGTVIPQTQANDSLAVYTTSAYNVVVDHCSLSWAGDKNSVAIQLPTDAHVSYWRNIISEALYRSKNVVLGTDSAPSSLGVGIFQNYNNLSAKASFIGNLLAHNSDRNPEIQGPVEVHVINNVIYDWGKDDTAYPWATFLYSENPAVGPMKVDVIGNKYIAGPPPSPFTPLVAIGTFGIASGTQLYMSDNAIDQTRQAVTLYTHTSIDAQVGSPPVSLSGITVQASSGIEAAVLGWAGARPVDRDAVDVRVVNDVRNRTGTVISSQSQVGGWPTLAVNTRALTTPSNPHVVTGSGYTNLEIWLQGYAAVVEGAARVPSAPTNLRVIS